MSVEKLKCPRSHPVLTFSRLQYSESDCLQPRGSKEVLYPLPGIWSWPDPCRIFGLCSSLLIFRAKISKTRLFKMRILFYLLFLEEKRVWPASLPFFWKIHWGHELKKSFDLSGISSFFHCLYLIWNYDLKWFLDRNFCVISVPTSPKHQPVLEIGREL